LPETRKVKFKLEAKLKNERTAEPVANETVRFSIKRVTEMDYADVGSAPTDDMGTATLPVELDEGGMYDVRVVYNGTTVYGSSGRIAAVDVDQAREMKRREKHITEQRRHLEAVLGERDTAEGKLKKIQTDLGLEPFRDPRPRGRRFIGDTREEEK
jgi:hypothetical protein